MRRHMGRTATVQRRALRILKRRALRTVRGGDVVQPVLAGLSSRIAGGIGSAPTLRRR